MDTYGILNESLSIVGLLCIPLPAIEDKTKCHDISLRFRRPVPQIEIHLDFVLFFVEVELRYLERTMVRNSSLVRGSFRKTPTIMLVTVRLCVF